MAGLWVSEQVFSERYAASTNKHLTTFRSTVTPKSQAGQGFYDCLTLLDAKKALILTDCNLSLKTCTVALIRYSYRTINSATAVNGKGKAIPITGLDRHTGFQEVEAPRFQDNRHIKVVRLSALPTGRLYSPGNIPGTHFCERLS
jgi:hypothetical protein